MAAGGAAFYVGPDAEPNKYRLRSEVGGGGEAHLWAAEVNLAGEWEPVAVKMLRADLAPDLAVWQARWAEQAELLHFLRHPAVVGVREHFEGPAMHLAGEAPVGEMRSLYLVMNWVEGMDLRSWVPLNRTPEGLIEGLRYLQQIASVLDWLHSGQATPSGREVIHADVTPANVIVTPEGQAVLVDFGLLRLASQRSTSAEGTRGFMAPEVANSGQYSPASDRFSFGGLAYYVLTGTYPPADLGQLRAGLAEVGVIASQRGVLDEALSIFDPDPARRPSAGEWVRLLRLSSSTVMSPTTRGLAPPEPSETPTEAPPPKPKRRRRLVLALVVLAILAGGGGYALARFKGPAKAPAKVAVGGSTAGGHPRPGGSVEATKATVPAGSAVATTTTTVAPATTTTTLAPAATSTMAPPTAAAPATTATTVINTQYGAQPVDLINDNNNPYVTLDDGDGIESVNINGKYFGYGAKGSGYGGGTGEIDFNLSRAFKTFKTRIGITDESGASCSTEIQIVDDGRTVVDHTLGLGQSQDVTVNVTGVLRVQVIFANTNNPGPGNCYAAIGNPTATPAAG